MIPRPVFGRDGPVELAYLNGAGRGGKGRKVSENVVAEDGAGDMLCVCREDVDAQGG